jgi:hypothetical protein
MVSVSASRGRSSAGGWISFRNILLGLIAMQITVLIAIGFTAPIEIESSLGDLLRGPFLASLNKQVKTHTRIKPLDSSPKLWKTLSEKWEKVGKYDTQGALTMNFLPERMHPSFRHAKSNSVKEFDNIVATSVKNIQMLLHGERIKSCRYHEMHGGKLRVLHRDACRAPNSAEIVAYNSLPFNRTWCGKTIKAHSLQRYETVCDGPVQLFIAQGRRTPPIRLLRTGSNAQPKPVHCTTPCHVATEECDDEGDCLPDISNWIVEDTELKFTYSMLTPSQNGNLEVDLKDSAKHLATRSFQSDIPLSYFDWTKYGKPTLPVEFDDAKGTSFFKSQGCKGVIRGDVWVNVTAQLTQLNSYGTCFHNTDLADGMTLDNRTDRESLLKKHLFHLVTDATHDPDFVDDAVWQALYAGVIPVYYGATNIKDHVPPNSIISAADYGQKVGMAERINEVANDRALWESYHEWRKHPFPAKLKAKYDFLHASPFCRMCRWSHAKKYGLGWNHSSQQVVAKAMGGRTCFCRSGAIMYPFQESWMTPTLSRDARGTCNHNWRNNATIKASDMNVNRTALQHDGVVDLRVDQVSHAEEELVVRLEFPVKNSGGAFFSNVHQLVPSDMVSLMTSIAIQDDRSRVTIVCNWPTRVWSPSEGIIQIAVQSSDEAPQLKDETRTIRIIPEDVDPLRDVRTEYSLSPYAKRVIEDFSKPLELYIIQS